MKSVLRLLLLRLAVAPVGMCGLGYWRFGISAGRSAELDRHVAGQHVARSRPGPNLCWISIDGRRACRSRGALAGGKKSGCRLALSAGVSGLRQAEFASTGARYEPILHRIYVSRTLSVAA
jgi:hypothetical protein